MRFIIITIVMNNNSIIATLIIIIMNNKSIIATLIIVMLDVAQVKLVCPMEGNPAPIIEWSKGEQMVSLHN